MPWYSIGLIILLLSLAIPGITASIYLRKNDDIIKVAPLSTNDFQDLVNSLANCNMRDHVVEQFNKNNKLITSAMTFGVAVGVNVLIASLYIICMLVAVFFFIRWGYWYRESVGFSDYVLGYNSDYAGGIGEAMYSDNNFIGN